MSWAKPVDELELKFRMERAIHKDETCDYHLENGGYQAGCWDCDIKIEWVPAKFNRELLPHMDEKGYINKRLRVCSNSLKKSDLSIREQVDAVVNKKET